MTLQRIRQNSFLVLGRAGLDLYADPPGTRTEDARAFTAALGGSAANIAAGIVRLGGLAALLTVVSDDAVGRFTVNELERHGISAAHVHTVGGEARNSLAVVETRAENCQSVIYRNGAADFQLTPGDVSAVDYAAFGALIVTGTSLASQPSRDAAFLAMERARKAGLALILDVDYRPYSWVSAADAAATCAKAARLCDIVIGNAEEFNVMAKGDGLSFARRLKAGIKVYKMGNMGSCTFSASQSFITGIYKVTALKPTGAGDAFMAGFVTGLAAGLELQLCVLRGSAAAAIVVTRVGCAPAMPTSAELSRFMADHPV